MKIQCRRVPGRHTARWWVKGIGPVFRLRDAKSLFRRRRAIPDGPHFTLQEQVGALRVSTVGDYWSLGIRIPLGFGWNEQGSFNEEWYETAVFGPGRGDIDIPGRYATKAEARIGHAEVVAQVRKAQTEGPEV